jgi:DNA-binding beta-propeller fold protein YncE
MKKCLLVVLLFGCVLHARDYTYTEHFPVLPQPWYFAYPEAMDIGPGGNLYVAHSRNRVSVFSPDGVFLKQYRFMVSIWGEMMPRSIRALAVDPSGNMYLADAQESALVKADPQGNIVNKFYNFYLRGDLETDAQGNVYFADTTVNDGLPGPMYPTIIKFDPQGNILLSFVASQSPTGLGLDTQGNIYVAATYYQIMKFDPLGNLLGSFGVYGQDPGKLDYPNDVEIDAQGNLYVTDSVVYRIQKFSSAFDFILQWGTQGSSSGQFHSVKSARIYQSKIFCLDGNNRIQIFDLNGNLITLWQPMGHDQGQFWKPGRVAVDNPGNVYVCDTGNHRVQKFDRKWAPDIVIGSEGTGQGQFKNPSGVYVDDEGNIYVADKDNYRVQKFDKKGQFLLQWGTKGVGNGQFETLLDIDGDRDGFIYTLDLTGQAIQKFTRQGQFALKFKASPHPDAHSVKGFGVNNNGLIYIAENWAKLYSYDTQGNFVGYIPDELKLDSPLDVAVGTTGDIFVADSKNGVAQFNPDGTFVAYLAAGTNVLQDVYIPTGVAVHNTGRLYICEEANGRVLVYEPKAGLKMTVPAAASVHGALGTDWRTDLSIFNPGLSAIDVTLDYHKADGALSSSFTLQPATFLSLPDVIGTTFNAPNTFGALTAICLNDDQPLIFSRTYNQTEQGTYGQGIRASPYGTTFYQGEGAYLTGLKNTADFRSNVGFFNLQDIPIEVQLVLYDEAGVEMASASYSLGALSHLQVNSIFSSLSLTGDHETAWARAWTDTLWGRFAAYGSIVDNRTGDPVYLEAKPLGGYMPEDFHWILPAVASTPGAYGTNWRTETVFTNSLLESNEITLTYHPATGGDPFVETFTLEPGEVKSYSDFLGEAFALDESFGWLDIDSSCAGLQARARIFTGEIGTYGQGLQAQQQTTLSLGTSPVYLLNLLENANYRSNLGLLNLSDTEMIFTLDLLKDSSVVSSKTLTFPAQTLQQLNGVLSSFFETSGDGFTVRITGPEGAAYTAYLSTVDNRTGDAVYQSFSSQ